MGTVQLLFSPDTAVYLAGQLYRVAGKPVIHDHHRLDHGAGGTGHLLVGQQLGLIHRHTGLQRHNRLGHPLVGVDNMQRQPFGQEGNDIGNHIIQRLDRFPGLQSQHIINKACMAFTVGLFPGVTHKVGLPNRFFGLEMDLGIVCQLRKDTVQRRGIGLHRKVTDQQIQQLHQTLVLLINLINPGLEILVPGKYLDRFRHGAPAVQPVPKCITGMAFVMPVTE